MITTLFAAIIAATQAPAPLAPSAKWTVSPSETACHLTRTFSAGETQDSLDVSIVPTQIVYALQEALRSKMPPLNLSQTKAGEITFLPQAETIKVNYQIVSTDDQYVARLMFVEKAAVDRLGAAETLVITTDESRRLSTKSLASALLALNKCGTELLAQWRSLAGASIPTAVAVAKPTLIPQAFGPNSYPADALRRKAEGVSVAILTVNEKGRVAGCVIVHSSEDATLDRASCRWSGPRRRTLLVRPP